MRYLVLALGRSDRGPHAAAIARYRQRIEGLGGDLEVRSLKASRLGSAGERRRADAATLLSAAAAAGGRTVLLDQRGTLFTTSGLSKHVTALERRGERSLALLLGAADGVDEAARQQVDETWSLSPLTLAHELALVVLLEQLYRLASIRRRHPYHRA